jgi:hypothetical protein
MMIKAISTEEKWELSESGKTYIVIRKDSWQTGDRVWRVIEREGVFDKYLHEEYDKEEIHRIVREIQDHLVQR